MLPWNFAKDKSFPFIMYKPTCKISEIRDNIDFFKNKTKSQCEFVITRFNESLDWIQGIEHLCTIYNKGTTFDISGSTVINVPNYGMGIETMLNHIIQRYNSLADVTMFCQGNIGDRSDQPIYPFVWYFKDTSVNDVRANITSISDSPSFKWGDEPETCTLKEFRETVIRIPYNIMTQKWVKGDWISVGRQKIIQHPLEYYSNIYNKCRFYRGIRIPELYYLERSFYIIFTTKHINKSK
jgi:hypothetical protein